LTDKDKLDLVISRDLLEKLAKFEEVELEEFDVELEEIEFDIQAGNGGLSSPILARLGYEFALIRDSANRMASLLGAPSMPMPQQIQQQLVQPRAPERVKPDKLLQEEAGMPSPEYPGEVVEVKLGATSSEGGTRSVSYVIGGEKVPAFYNFIQPTPNKPIIALDVFDWPKISLARAVRNHFDEYKDDVAEWSRVCVEKYGAEMVNVHLLTIDPLIEDAPPKEAVKTVEKVVDAVDVPISIGGCGDPQKDFEVFKAISENVQGENLLFNSVTLDMKIEETAKLVRDYKNTVIAFTSMDVNKARELNRKLYDFLDKGQILMDTTTAALGYGLDYAFTVMERCRLAALKGDPELNHPLSSGSTNAWAAREAWMKMGPEFAPRELRGPIWETVTAQTLLLAGVDYFMMMHPAAVNSINNTIDNLMKGERPTQATDWVRIKV
jgi:acetyl-CoA decarbonylase/synthase complex subunit delta